MLCDAVVAKYRPRLEGKKVMLFVGGLRPRHVIGAYEDLGMEIVGTGYEFGHNDDYQRTTHYVKDGTLIYDDVTGYEFEKFVEKIQPDLVGSGIKEKYVFQKMGVPFRQMHSSDYSGRIMAMTASPSSHAIWTWRSTRRSGSSLRPPGPPDHPEARPLALNPESEAARRSTRGIQMPQNADNVLDHFNLFRQPEYKEMFESKKKNFEIRSDAELERVREWTKSDEYREKNFAREALTVNPAKACSRLARSSRR